MIVTIKLIFLFFLVWFTYVNVALVYRKESVPIANIAVMSFAWTGFIYLQWLL